MSLLNLQGILFQLQTTMERIDGKVNQGINTFDSPTFVCVNAETLNGTLITQYQPNIRSIGVQIDDLDMGMNDIVNANTVMATSFLGTVLTEIQPNIASIGIQIEPLDLGGQNILNVNDIDANQVSATVLDGSLSTDAQNSINRLGMLSEDLDMGGNNINNIDTLFTNTILGAIQTPNQPNITKLGTLLCLEVDNVNIDGNTISANGDLLLDPSGSVVLKELAFPNSDGTSGQVLTTDGNGNLVFTTISGVGGNTTVNTMCVNVELQVDTVREKTLNNGVDIDSVLVKDGDVTATNVNATNITGTLQTAAQPNVTGLGAQASNLNMNGSSIVGVNSMVASVISGTVQTGTQPNITSIGAQASNLNMNGSSIVGVNSMMASVISGTLQTATQPNITSMGAQASNLNMNGSSIVGVNSMMASVISGTIQTGTQPNITSVGVQIANLDMNGNNVNNANTLNVGTVSSTTVTATSVSTDLLSVDNIDIDGNTISSSNTNGDILIDANGTGTVVMEGLSYPAIDGTNGQAIITDGAGNLTFGSASGGANLTADTLTSLTVNGDLTLSGNGAGIVCVDDDLNVDTITSKTTDNDLVLSGDGLGVVCIADSLKADIIISNISNGNLSLSGNGTGTVVIEGISYPVTDGSNGQLLSTDGAGNLTFKSAEIGLNIEVDSITSNTLNTDLVLSGKGTGIVCVTDQLSVDTINEKTATNGVTIDGVLLKDSGITGTLQTAAQTNITSLGTQAANLNMGTLNVTNAGTVSATNLTGTLSTAAQTNVTSVGTLTTLQVDNLNIDGNTISSTDTNGDIILDADGTGNVCINDDLNVDTIVSKTTNTDLTLSGNGTGVVKLGDNLDMNSNNLTNATNVTATNLTGTLQTAAQANVTSVGTLAALQVDNLNFNGNTITSTDINGNIVLDADGTGVICINDDLNVDTIVSKTTNTDLTLSGNGTGVVKLGDNLDMNSNNVTNATSITATNLTGTLQTAAQANVTSVGTLTSLQVDNINLNGNTISSTDTNGDIVLDANGTGTVCVNDALNVDTIVSKTTNTDLTLSGNGTGIVKLDDTLNMNSNDLTNATSITATNLTGTLQTAAQANVTSVGTLTSLQVDNLNFNGNTIASTDTNGNIILDTNGTGIICLNDDLNVDTIVSKTTNTDLTLSGNGTGVVKLDDNLDMNSLDITNATSITATNLTGTLQTAAQGNITSLGTVTTLTTSGNVTVGGDLTINGTTTTVDSAITTISDNLIIVNSGPNTSRDGGYLVERFQTDNDAGTGDVVGDVAAISDTLGDQTGMATIEVKLHAGASASDNFYNCWWIKITSGPSINQVRKVTDYVGDTKVATVQSIWTTQNPATSDLFELFNKPFIGSFYDESENKWTFAATASDPGASPVIVNDRISLSINSLCLEDTQQVEWDANTNLKILGTVASGMELYTPTGTTLEHKVNGTTETTLGSTGVNTATGNTFQIGGTAVLSGTALGSGITSSSLTSFGTLTVLDVDNIRLDGNTVSSTDTNGNLILDANGTGVVCINDDLNVDNIISKTTNTDLVLSGNGTGVVKLGDNLDVDSNNITNVTTMTATNLGGTLSTAAQTNVTSLGTLIALQVDNLNINGNTLTSTDTNGNIILDANGTGVICLNDDLTVDNIISKTTNTDLLLSGNGTGVVKLGDNLDVGSNNITNVATLTATDLGGTLSTVAQTNVTSLGTLVSLQVDDINVNGNTISTTTINADLILDADGTGVICLNDDLNVDNIISKTTNTDLVLTGNGTGIVKLGDNLNLDSNSITNVVTLTATNLGGTLSTVAQTNITSLGTLTALNVDNLNINGNTITSTNINGDIILDANGIGIICLNDDLNVDVITAKTTNTNLTLSGDGTGTVVIEGISYPFADGSNGQVMTTNGSGVLTFTTVSGAGANLTADTLTSSATNGDLTLSGNGTGIVCISDELSVDIINEKTGTAGVTIDGVLLKDASITCNNVTASSATTSSFERTVAFTSTGAAIMSMQATSSGDMVDGFGTSLQFNIEDTAATANLISRLDVLRNGADNTGQMDFVVYSAGTPLTPLSLESATATVAGNLDITSSVYPVTQSTRTTASTTSAFCALELVAESSGNAGDTFGPCMTFSISDTGVTDNAVGHISCVRDGADNTGKIVLAPYSAGAPVEVMEISATEVKLSKSLRFDPSTSDIYFGTGIARIEYTGGLLYDVLIADIHDFRIANTTVAQIKTTGIDVPSGSTYQINGATILSAAGIDVPSGATYQINGITILSATGLASSVVSSSLTSVGILTGLTVDSGDATELERISGGTTSTALILKLKSTTSGNMVDDFGGHIQFYIEDDAATENLIARIDVSREGADNSGKIELITYSAGTPTAVITAGPTEIKFTKDLRFDPSSSDIYFGTGIVRFDYSAGAAMIYDVLTAEIHDFRIANSQVMDVRSTGANLVSGGTFLINGTSVLSSTNLGSAVVNSSLTSVGTLTGLNVSGMGAVSIVSSAEAIDLIRLRSSGTNVNTYAGIAFGTDDTDIMKSAIFHERAAMVGSGQGDLIIAVDPDNDTNEVVAGDEVVRITSSGVTITGSISKTSGTFEIPHPDPNKEETHRLKHSFIEGPTRGENIYRYAVSVTGGIATITLPDYFKYLNENVQIFTSPVNVFGIARGNLTDPDTVTIEANVDGDYNILIMGTRKDKYARSYWDPTSVEFTVPSEKQTIHNKQITMANEYINSL
jgi:hypothetical protein